MSAAGAAEPTDAARIAAQPRGIGLQPSDAEIDVGDRGRIGRSRRHAKIERKNRSPGFRDHLVERGILQPVVGDPRTAMHIHDAGEIRDPARAVKAGEQRGIADPAIFDVLDDRPRAFVRHRSIVAMLDFSSARENCYYTTARQADEKLPASTRQRKNGVSGGGESSGVQPVSFSSA